MKTKRKRYLNAANRTDTCKMLYPMMTDQGSMACGSSDNWMRRPIMNPNTLIIHLLKGVYDNIMKGGFWYCKHNTVQNQVYGMHLIRWMGQDMARILTNKFDAHNFKYLTQRQRKCFKCYSLSIAVHRLFHS